MPAPLRSYARHSALLACVRGATWSRKFRLAMLAGTLVSAAACEDTSYRDIGAEINLISHRDDAFVSPAVQRLAKYGRHALPQIETALHAAPEAGRLHLVATLEVINDPEAVPILRHLAIFDPSQRVREAREALLKG